MRGDSESASKNTSEPIFKYLKYSKIRISENSLASDLVFVVKLTDRHIQMIWEIVNCSENLVSEILSQSEDVTIEAVAESMTDLIQEIETTVL